MKLTLPLIGIGIFLFVSALLGYLFPVWVYIAIPVLLLIMVVLAIYFGSAKKTKDGKTVSVGKGKAKTAIVLILIVLLVGLLAAAAYGFAFFGSADKTVSVGGQSSVNLGSDFDFGTIEIVFAETPKTGDAIEVNIGQYKARTDIGRCKYYQDRDCYKGWWSYNNIGVSSADAESFYDQGSNKPLKIKKIGSLYGAIWIGNSAIIELDQSTILTPKPVEGEKTVSCSSCKIMEVKLYYNFTARIKSLIGLE